jgi:phage host-nuclease inhibitor protein Gam
MNGNNFIDALIAEADADETKQTLTFYDLIIAEVIRLEAEIAQTFTNAEEEVRIVKEWALKHCSGMQDKINLLKLKLEAYIREEGKKTIDLPHGTLKMRKLPDKVEISDMDKFLESATQEVITIVPETVKPDLNKIKAYLKNSGHILPGITVIEGKEEFKLTINNKSKENQ